MCIITSSAVTAAIGITGMAAKIAAISANVAMAATAISGAVGTVASVKSSNANAKMSEYQARVARDNEKIAQENARNERQSGLEEARLQRLKTIQTIGAQQTAMAANGIDISSGTALDTVADSAQMGELDALMLQYNAERNAYGYDTQAGNFKNQANLDMFASKNYKTEATINGISGTVNTIGNTASSIASYGSRGMTISAPKVNKKWNLFDKGQMTGYIPAT